MKKYALITIHDTQNYGSCLQTFSLWKALHECGCDIDLLDYENYEIWKRECSQLTNIFESPKKLVKYILRGKDQKEKLENIRTFLRENTSVSRKYTRDNIFEANKYYDAFVTGSDIVWGEYITGSDLSYFLDFTEDDKERYAFSSSIGTKWGTEYAKKVKPLLERYDSIALREVESVVWVEELIGKKVSAVCDPTNLWAPSYWSEYLLDDYAPKEDYVLVYLIHNDGKNLRDGIEYAKKHGMNLYYISFYTNPKGVNVIKPKTVNEWITLIANAKIVFTASFHGTLFSLYFKTPLFFYNRGAKSRLNSLAADVGIEYREGLDENIDIDKEIDFEKAHRVLEEKRENSWTELRKIVR